MNPETQQTNSVKHLGGTYLKPGMLKREAVVPIEGRNGGPRFIEGKYGRQIEIPIKLDGQDFVVSIPADKGDGQALQAAFPANLAEWPGRRISVADSVLLNRVRVQPIG